MNKAAVKKIGFSVLVLLILGTVTWAYLPTLTSGSPPLMFHWEGAVQEKLNFRDAGESINACARKKMLPEGVILRASGFFSGWSCERVGNPTKIYSLNYSDAENRRYYCRGDAGNTVGEYFQHDELSDLEFIQTWDDHPDFAEASCKYLTRGIAHVEANERFLYQCDAGRDRTGALTALLAGWILEKNGPLTDDMIEAIECDYRKSASLKPYKYGRIKTLLTVLRSQYGGVRGFLQDRCCKKGTPDCPK